MNRDKKARRLTAEYLKAVDIALKAAERAWKKQAALHRELDKETAEKRKEKEDKDKK